MKKVTAILLGAGQRGSAYADYAREFPDELQIVAAAEPDHQKRNKIAKDHGIAPCDLAESWEALLARPRFADACLVCTLDQMHTKPALRALELGYHVLLEKPMAPTEEECRAIAQAADASGKVLSVCHVLRYTPFYTAVKACIDRGDLGEIVAITQTENVGYWHQAHSFVRGNWGNTKATTPMILQKCCHDMDIFTWLLGRTCLRVASSGSLTHFKPENAPPGATAYCLDGCPHRASCIYDAPTFYLTQLQGFSRMICTDPTPEKVLEALHTSRYGRCVYHCDNDAVDHQIVSMEFEGGVTASLTMCAFTQECDRTLHIMGTRGELWGDMERESVTVQPFGTAEPVRLPVERPQSKLMPGHNGGDFSLMRNFVEGVRENAPEKNRSGARQSLQSHLMCFAAEKARLSGVGLGL